MESGFLQEQQLMFGTFFQKNWNNLIVWLYLVFKKELKTHLFKLEY